MNTRKLWRALCATILCVALLCGMAVAEDDITLEIDAINTAEEDVTMKAARCTRISPASPATPCP